jgi:glycosyltransferase involved in cell wall biosynthesis
VQAKLRIDPTRSAAADDIVTAGFAHAMPPADRIAVNGSRPALACFLPSLHGGGAERVIVNIAAGFAQRGVPTDIVLSRAEGPYAAQVPAGVRIVDLSASRVLRSVLPLAQYLRRERPRTLLAALDYANIVAIVAARLARTRTRTVISVHCTFPKSSRRLIDVREAAIPWLLGRVHRWADAIVAVSEGVAVDLAATTGIPLGRIDVIYNPVIWPGLASEASKPPAHAWFEDSSRPIVLGVGRLEPQKNFPLLLEAFQAVRRVRDARLVILGEGSERSALEAYVREHGLQDSVSLPGFLDNPYACMSRAAVLALSSNFEGLPTVLIESLALGTPVVSTDCESGPREILRDGALGDLVPVNDATSLAQALIRALDARRRTVPLDALRPFMFDAALDRLRGVLQFDA